MSPEQARGDHVGAPTDVYALGCVLFEILAGKPALPRGMEGILAAIAGEIVRPSKVAADVPPELDDLCASATAVDPSQRPTARVLAQGIQAFLDGDRDVVRRCELAAQLATAAHDAIRDDASDSGRAVAMRDAGRALALDPDNAMAQHVLGRLLLDAPATLPAEALASADHERGETRQKAMRFAGYGYLASLPAIATFLLLPLRHVWPIVALLVLAVTTGVASLMLSRNVLQMRTPWMVVLVGLSSLILVVLGLIFSPLLIMPIFLIGSLAGVLQQPSAYPAWIGVVAHAFPLVLLLFLEAIGVLPSTFEVSAKGLVFTLWVIDLTPTITMIVFCLAFVTVSAFIAGVTVIGRRAAETAQNHQHAIAWHLRQMLPRANDRLDSTGRAAKL
jgi:serine/threonine-protein kinase